MDTREELLKKVRKSWFKNVDQLLTAIEKENKKYDKAMELINSLSYSEKELLDRVWDYRIDFQVQELRDKLDEYKKSILHINY